MLSAKQGAGMFNHADADLAFVEIELDDKPKRVLIIKTPLSLWPMSQDYREDRVSARASRRNFQT
jgi:hypothetical protein